MKATLTGLMLLALTISACNRQSGERNGNAGDQADTSTIFQDTVKNNTLDSPSRQETERLRTDTSRRNR